MKVNELLNIPFPDCGKTCEMLTLLGVSECSSVCPEKFDEKDEPLSYNQLLHLNKKAGRHQ